MATQKNLTLLLLIFHVASALDLQDGCVDEDCPLPASSVMQTAKAPQKARVSMDATKLEQLVLAEVGKETPDINNVKEIKEILEILTEELLPNIYREHGIDQKMLDSASQRLDRCVTDKVNKTEALKEEEDAMMERKTEHMGCRQEESKGREMLEKAWAELWLSNESMIEACRYVDEYQLGFQGCAPFPRRPATTNYGVVDNNKELYSEFENQASWTLEMIGRLQASYEQQTKLLRSCKHAVAEFEHEADEHKKRSSEVEIQTHQCNEQQKFVEKRACDYGAREIDMCTGYNKCYKDEKAAYETERARVEAAVLGRQNETWIIARISCYIEALITAASNASVHVTASDIETCKTRNHAADEELVIDYPSIDHPEPGACKRTYVVGTPAFTKTFYTNLPDNVNLNKEWECADANPESDETQPETEEMQAETEETQATNYVYRDCRGPAQDACNLRAHGLAKWSECGSTGRCWKKTLEEAQNICDAHVECTGITRDNGGYEPRTGVAVYHVAAHEMWLKQA